VLCCCSRVNITAEEKEVRKGVVEEEGKRDYCGGELP